MNDCKWCFGKKYVTLTKNLMLQIDPLNSNCPKNYSTPKEN